MKIAVSACLVGKNTKYDGNNNYNKAVMEYLKDKEYILICPEVTGGLPTPRVPSERVNDKVINKENIDVTHNFVIGASKTIEELKKQNIELVIVKSKSPSCGYKQIYDGSFTGTIIEGNGVFTELAVKNGLKILTEKDIENKKFAD
ncbi:MAG: DUF523 domain-containing protein [Treponema sp.]|nr:DUF523 domain-containing protein [Treponema sp.]